MIDGSGVGVQAADQWAEQAADHSADLSAQLAGADMVGALIEERRAASLAEDRE